MAETLAELERLSDAELDRMVAERVMGWAVRNGMILDASEKPLMLACHFHPATQAADAARMRAKLAERGRVEKFCKIIRDNFRSPGSIPVWDYLNLSPRVQCLAALLAVSEGEPNG